MKRLKHLEPLLRSPVLTWEYILVSFLLAAVLGRAIALLNDALFPQKYTQLAVGDIAWDVGSKQPDYLILVGFIGWLVVLYPGFRLLAHGIRQTNGEAAEAAFRKLLVYALIPLGVWVGTIFLNDNPSLELILVSTVLVLLVLLFAGVLYTKRLWFDAVQPYIALVGGSLLVILFALFGGVGLTLALTRLNLSLNLSSDTVLWVAIASLVVFSLGLVRVWLTGRARPDTPAPRRLEVLLKRLRGLLGLVQALLPLLFLVLLPTPWTTGTQRFYGYPMTPLLYGLITVLVVASYSDLGRRCLLPGRQRLRAAFGSGREAEASSGIEWAEDSGPEFFSVLSPLCLVALLLFIKAPIVGAGYLPADDYHWGEFVLPWWLWQDFHALPFWDYEPARGLVNYVPGLLANLFLNGDVASYLAVTGKPLMFLPFLLVAFPVLAYAIGGLPAFLALTLMPSPGGLFEIDILVTVALCLLGEAFGRWRRVTWLLLWLVSCMALILFAPGQGGLFAIATFPVTAVVLYQAVRQERRNLLRGAIAVGIGLGLLLLFTPLGQMLLGAIRYGAEQSSLNSVAYGIEWFKSRGSNPFLSYPLWEFVRTSWIVVSAAICLILYQVMVTRNPAERPPILVYAVPIFLITVLLIPRSAGRIDPGSLSRLGNTSIWVACLLLPIVLVKVYGRRGLPLSLLVVAVLGGLLGFAVEAPPSLERAVRQPVEVVNATGLPLTDGNQVGMPVLNRAILEPAHLKRLQKLKLVLDALLQPGETYLDLTSRNAQYFYLGYPPPVQAGGVYNLVHKNQQLRAVKQLEKILPPVALATEEATQPDGNTTAVRSHLLYRYVLEHYVPVVVDQFIVLVRPDRLSRVQNLAADPAIASEFSPNLVIGTADPLRLALFDQSFRLPNVDGLPSSWGQSFRSLQGELTAVVDLSARLKPTLQGVEALGDNRYRVTAANPSIRYDLSALSLNGRDAGLLAFDFSCRQRSRASFPIRWESKTSKDLQANSVNLTARNGKQLVPLDAAPRWLLAQDLVSLRFDPVDAACPEVSLSDVVLFQRKDL